MEQNELTRLEELDDTEQLALGGLIRVLIRLDGSFSEEEESYLEELGNDLGTAEDLWKVISRSAQEHANDDAIRTAARGVSRKPAQRLIRTALERVAIAGTIEPAERALLEWVDDAWGLSAD
ncbi:MAG: hypothetical protein AB8I08_40280 [Sandaracinaceae bacterium]